MIEKGLEQADKKPLSAFEGYVEAFEARVEVEPTDKEKSSAEADRWWNRLEAAASIEPTDGEAPADAKPVEDVDSPEEKPLVEEGEQYDEDGKLKPNIRYRTDDGEGRSYYYETDGQGRIIKAVAKNLMLKNRENRLKHMQDTPGKRETDDAGHLFGDQFGGSPNMDNLVSQDRNLNRNRSDYADNWYKMEQDWAKALKDEKEVSVEIQVNYEGDSERPSSFDVRETIDGESQVRSYSNEPKGEHA